MPRGIEVNWDDLANIVQNQDSDPNIVIESFTEAFKGLLAVNETLLQESLEYSNQAQYLESFIDVFRQASGNAINTIQEINPAVEPNDFSRSLRLSAIPNELLAYSVYVDAPNEQVSLEKKIDTAEQVQGSIKEFIKKSWNRWWLEPVLKTLDEVLNIFRGI